MPLFTFIAGFLYGYLYNEKGKYKDFKNFFIKKVNRLLVPFIVLGTVINLLEYGKNIKDIFYGTPNHMWYCLMLFYVFIACWLIERYLGEKINILLMLFSFGVVTYYGLGALSHRVIGGFFLPLYYYGYFYFGVLFQKYKEKYTQHFPTTAIFILLIYVLTCIIRSNHLIVIRSISYAILLYTIVNKMIIKKSLFDNSTNENAILLLSKYSFGVYVFHQWIIWNLTREPHCLNVMRPLLTEHYILTPIVLATCVFTLSMVLTRLSLQTKVGRYLLL